MNRILHAHTRWLAVLAVVSLTSSCGGGSDTEAPPTTRLYATFVVGPETFHAFITHPEAIAQAKALWTGRSQATIPVGALVCTAQPWNQPWHWHMDPESIRFAEVTIELCDGLPSHVEATCPGFAVGTYCPWGAQMKSLRDCSSDPNCP